MDTPKRGTIDELCRRFVGTIGIGEDHFAGIPKLAKYIFPLPTAPSAAGSCIKAIAGLTSSLTQTYSRVTQQVDGFEDGSIKIVDFSEFSRDKHNLQLAGNLFR